MAKSHDNAIFNASSGDGGAAMVNLYQPRTMLRALDQVKVPRRFFHETFFGTVVTHTTKDVEFDVRTKNRRVARFVNPIHDGVLVEREGFATFKTSPGYIKEMTSLRPQETDSRAFGENIYTPMSPAQRAARLLGEDLAMLDERLVRLEEKMCAEAILEGRVTVKGKAIDNSVEFGYEVGKHIKILSGTGLWSDPSADPMRDLDNWRREILQRCGIAPNICLTGSEAAWAIMDNAKVKERLNILNYTMGKIAPGQPSRPGISYYGDLMLSSGVVSLYSYDEWYTDPETGEDVPLMPNNKVLLGSTEARAEFHYGLIQNLRSLGAQTRFAFSWEKPDGSARFVQLESAPMPNLYQPDAFIVATVL